MPVTKRLIIILIPVVLIILVVIASLIVLFRPKNEAIEDINGIWVVFGQQCPGDTEKINNAESLTDLAFCIENFNLIDGNDINEYDDAPPGCIRKNEEIIFNLQSSGVTDPDITYYEFCKNSQNVEQTINPGCARQSQAQNVFNVEQLCCQDVGCTNPNEKSRYDSIHCFDDGSCNPVLLANEQYRFKPSSVVDSYVFKSCSFNENVYQDSDNYPQALLENAYNPYDETVGAQLTILNNFEPNFEYVVTDENREDEVTYCIETPKTFYIYIDYLSFENARVYGKDRSGVLEFTTQIQNLEDYTDSTQLQFYDGDTVVFFVYNNFYLGTAQDIRSMLDSDGGDTSPTYTFNTVGTYYYGVEDVAKICGSILITPREKIDSDSKQAHFAVIEIKTNPNDELGFVSQLGGFMQADRPIFAAIQETHGDLVSQKNPSASNLSLRKFNPSIDSDDNIEEFAKDEHGSIVGVRVVIQLIDENGNCVSPGLQVRNSPNSEGWIQGSEDLIDFEPVGLYYDDSLTIYQDEQKLSIVDEQSQIFVRGATYQFTFEEPKLQFAIYSHVVNENPSFPFSTNSETVTKNIFNRDFMFTYNLTPVLSGDVDDNLFKFLNDSDENLPTKNFTIEYPYSVMLKSYKITIDQDDPVNLPSRWVLQGSNESSFSSNDVISLITTNSQINWINGSDTWETTNQKSYKYYRIIFKDPIQKKIKRIQFYEQRMQEYREGVSYFEDASMTQIKIPYDAPSSIIIHRPTGNNLDHLELASINVVDDASNRPYFTVDDVYSNPQTGPMLPLNKVIDKNEIDPMKYRIELYEL